MSYRPIKAQTTSRVLQSSISLQRLVARAQATDRLQHLLNQFLQPAAREHCLLASYQTGIMTLIISNGHWATRLRYQQKRLLEQLQGLDEFSDISRIQLKVRPPVQGQKLTTRNIELSEQAGQTIQDSAEGTQNPALREALERLALHAKKHKPT
ncbi:MAG TPA: DciA family protein [Thiopseudomonas sp.]|nr:DciA family protein [Thiopseudomonas sp.]